MRKIGVLTLLAFLATSALAPAFADDNAQQTIDDAKGVTQHEHHSSGMFARWLRYFGLGGDDSDEDSNQNRSGSDNQ